MADPSSFRAGEFSIWLRETREALLHDTGADVPCGECNSCCSSSYFIHVGPQETEVLAAIPGELLFPAPGASDGTLVMGYDEHGACAMLREGACTIYVHRPITCRVYDCRVFSATGIAPDQAGIAERTQRWEFSFPAEQDRAEYAAVRAAADFVQLNADEFPPGFLPSNPAQLAVLAIRVYDAFLDCDSGAEDSHDDALAQQVAAIVAAAGRFESERSQAEHHSERSPGL
jgi:Fe-S-cluster containining protein